MSYKLSKSPSIMLEALHPEITGSCLKLSIELPYFKTAMLVDCGVFQEEKYRKLNGVFNFNEGLKDVEYVFLTHGHEDHIGNCAYLYKYGYTGNIYTTAPTRKFLSNSLAGKSKYSYNTNEEKYNITFSNNEIEKTKGSIIDMEYGKTLNLSKNISVTFFENGHMLGAAIIVISITYFEDGKKKHFNIDFTGDFSNTNPFINIKALPYHVLNAPTFLVQEATYGDRHKILNSATFDDIISDSISNKKQNFILSNSLEKFEQIMLNLRKKQDKNIIPSKHKILFDGTSAFKGLKVYKTEIPNFKNSAKDFIPKNSKWISHLERETLIPTKTWDFLIAPSGTGDIGISKDILPLLINKRNINILFTSYLPENSIGKFLLDLPHGKYISHPAFQTVKLANVAQAKEFSLHNPIEPNITFAKGFKNLLGVFVQHGSNYAKATYANELEKHVNIPFVAILSRDIFIKVKIGLNIPCYNTKKPLNILSKESTT
ncbi:MAG: MBL fold metallo-hydrolase [Clostridia bacterium]